MRKYVDRQVDIKMPEVFMREKMSWDLKAAVIVTLLTAFVISIPFSILPLRIVLGLMFVSLLPGYALIAALFPGEEDLDWIERVALSFGFSIAVASLTGLLLNYTPWGIKLNSILVSLSFFIISMSVAAAFRRNNLPVDERFFIDFSSMKMRFTEFASAGSVFIRAMAIISFALIILALILIRNSPAAGYEPSIYSSVPLVWIFLIGSAIGGIGIVVHQAFTEGKNNYWLIGFFILILTNFNILSMHALKGYLYYAASDHMGQLIGARNILSTGHFGSNNLHPVINIYISQISEICGICPDEIARYLPPFLSVFFMMTCVYLLAKEALPGREQILIASAASCILFFNSLHVQVYPHFFSVLLFPLILYLYLKTLSKPSWQFSLLFILLLILLPYSHPSASLTMIFLLIAMELARIIHDKRVYGSERSAKMMLNPVLISSITFFMWISSFAVFGATLSSIHSSLFEPYKATAVRETLEVMEHLRWGEIIEYTLKMYGDNLIYITLGIIAGAIVIKRIIKRERSVRYLFLLFMFLLMSVLVEYVLMVGVGYIKMGRVLNLMYLVIVAPVLVGFLLCELFKNKTRAKAVVCVSLILILTFSVSIFSVYHSPWIFSPSWHITNMDVKGSNWFFEYRNSTLPFDAMGTDPSIAVGKRGLIPAHFNYSCHETLGESLAQDSYAAINKRCKLASAADPVMQKARLNMHSGWGFDEKDFDKLENDPSVAKLYSNGEFDTFLVYSSNMQGVRER